MAFNEMTTSYVKGAIGSEVKNAVENWGERYNSLHEGVAVLKEEVDETRDEYIQIKNLIYDVWNNVRFNNPKVCKTNVKALRDHAEKLALEAVQICAVCEKMLKGI